MNAVAPYMKTAVAILGAVLTAVMTQFPDNEDVQQWGPIVSALLTALAVYAVPNRDPLAEHQDESVQPPAEQRILGKALYNPESPTVEQPGGMRARPVDPGDHDA